MGPSSGVTRRLLNYHIIDGYMGHDDTTAHERFKKDHKFKDVNKNTRRKKKSMALGQI
jgi:hypothetical protein